MLAPLFDKPAVRWATANRLSLYGLGIPPAQYEALAGGRDMGAVLRDRVERLACGFSLHDNYFAWQAFGRSYAGDASGPLPPYLRRDQFDAVRRRADRVEVMNRSVTEYLASCPAGSRDRYVLLDAQDWMTDAQLNALWTEITRTARPGARVVFRTAAEPSLLPGRIDRRCCRAGATRRRRRSPSRNATGPRSMAASISMSSRADVSDITALPGRSAELMDRIYRRRRHVYDLSRKYYLLGRDRMIDQLAPPPGERVLEIGCGTARNLIAVARRYPEAALFGIDISTEMLLTARQIVEREGLASRVRLAHADATRFDPAILFGVPSFSRIFISYSLSMIPAWESVLAQALAWVRPGGELHIVDFGGQERLPLWFRVAPAALACRVPCRAARRLESLAGRTDPGAGGGLSRFERPYRGYAQYAVCRRSDPRIETRS